MSIHVKQKERLFTITYKERGLLPCKLHIARIPCYKDTAITSQIVTEFAHTLSPLLPSLVKTCLATDYKTKKAKAEGIYHILRDASESLVSYIINKDRYKGAEYYTVKTIDKGSIVSYPPIMETFQVQLIPAN